MKEEKGEHLQLLQKSTHFIIKHQKTVFINITTDLIRKTFSVLGSCQVLCGGRVKFSKILIFVWNLKFDHWQQITVCYVSWFFKNSWFLIQILFIRFWENVFQYISLSKCSLSVILLSKRWCCMKKKLVQFITETVTHVLTSQCSHCISIWRKLFANTDY